MASRAAPTSVPALTSIPAPKDMSPPGASASDAKLRARLRGELADRKWTFARHNTVVRNGIVHLWG
ncbi:BON domain-containing protein [Mycetohabitans endofungorum]|uniref:hypothetical protein n=1 Tax=Mycetohabitans endofungorum TaxID=417203 RepID=UPI002B054924|nr:hypothetical protein [Mycetohabitans endofungorum]